MFGDKLNFGALLKNAKKMQEMMETTKDELSNIEVIGEAGAGAVQVTMTARYQAKAMTIDEDIFKEGQVIVTELVLAAFNNATSKVEKITQEKMLSASKLFGGLGEGDSGKE